MVLVSQHLSAAITLRPPELTDGVGIRSNSLRFLPASKKPISISFAATSQDAIPSQPVIELEFIGPKAGNDGSYPVERAKEISGEKLLRNIMADNKIQLYATYGKVMNCGGGGSCGTCIVEILDGKDLLNERTNTELKYLKKKPESWRLACQTIVGNKENSGKVYRNVVFFSGLISF
ncbi:photosynthetic NDH subunit of subcomplex B 3, chloroplastic isoform X1 [Cannabis sativa]|uniref:photosynthetic NDH subunit of subcomplex B 3, chloroplastic isoform X1 n=1 Tax=Cannabis sativa TaxID=3483 RepID=UPI0029CA9F97|nr:photosynthetic NDH subunit of subcomplex B 3, chloroplastic isoform X1 [Cannabis sativa]